ncbi:unnamed protein product [Protopolystoma xenopodis]|uniref:Uncharacterized protein n=1 Tax=Protopolystoma xenopodis TaxID=117903 RepID=A0A448XHL0_9PLAT|nr:unnamed protein product [Protopolystoma xenopodis]
MLISHSLDVRLSEHVGGCLLIEWLSSDKPLKQYSEICSQTGDCGIQPDCQDGSLYLEKSYFASAYSPATLASILFPVCRWRQDSISSSDEEVAHSVSSNVPRRHRFCAELFCFSGLRLSNIAKLRISIAPLVQNDASIRWSAGRAESDCLDDLELDVFVDIIPAHLILERPPQLSRVQLRPNSIGMHEFDGTTWFTLEFTGLLDQLPAKPFTWAFRRIGLLWRQNLAAESNCAFRIGLFELLDPDWLARESCGF